MSNENGSFAMMVSSIVVAIVIVGAVLVPIVNSAGGDGNGGSINATGSSMVFTNESDFHYQDYDKAVADAMSVSYEVVENGSSVYATVTVGSYTATTPTRNVSSENIDWENGDSPDKYQIVLPVFQVKCKPWWVEDEEKIYNADADVVFFLYGSYNGDNETYSFKWAVAGYFDGTQYGHNSWYSAGVWDGFDEEWENISTIANLIHYVMWWNEYDDADYTSVRLLSASGDYDLGKNPVVNSMDGLLSFNISRTYYYYGGGYYTTGIVAHGSDVIQDSQLENYNGSSSYYNYPVITLNTSSINDAVRLDSYSVLYVGDSSNRFSYLAFADVYAIVPATVGYTLASGTNTTTNPMKYYASVPTVDLTVTYTVDERVVDGETRYSIATATVSDGTSSYTIDNRANLDWFYNAMASASTIDEEDAVYMQMNSKSTVCLVATPTAMIDKRLEYGLSESITPATDTISVSSNGIEATIDGYSDDYPAEYVAGYCYVFDGSGTYGFFKPSATDGIYVTSDIFGFEGPIYVDNPTGISLGFAYIYNGQYSQSMYEIGTSLSDTIYVDIEDGKLTDIGYVGGFRQTGNNPNGNVGEMSSAVILPLMAENGSGGGSGGSGVTQTILAIVPVFLILGILMYAVQYMREQEL